MYVVSSSLFLKIYRVFVLLNNVFNFGQVLQIFLDSISLAKKMGLNK